MREELLRLLDEAESELDIYIEKYNGDLEAVYYNYYPEKLAIFLHEALSVSPYKDFNARIVIEYLDRLLKVTTNNNCNWITCKSVLSKSDFIDKLVASLDKFPYKDELKWLIYEISVVADRELKLFNSNMFDKLLGLYLDSDSYCFIFSFGLSASERIYFIQRSIDLKIPIDFRIFPLNESELDLLDRNILNIASYYKDIIVLKQFACSSKEDLVKYIDNHPEMLLDTICYFFKKHRVQYSDDTRIFLDLLIEDVVRNENIKYSDIAIATGGFSIVLLAGSKVIKIGESRASLSFPNNPYILQPLVRGYITGENNSPFIEITERVDTTSPFSKRELYNLYRNIRNLGLVWTDVTENNVGRLLKDNVIHWNEPLEPDDITLNFSGHIGNFVLPAGSLVVLDADFIFDEKDSNKSIPNSYYEEFEKRYQKELKEERAGILTTVNYPNTELDKTQNNSSSKRM